MLEPLLAVTVIIRGTLLLRGLRDVAVGGRGRLVPLELPVRRLAESTPRNDGVVHHDLFSFPP